jgi:large subunit ribosomal protein L23
MDSRKAILYPLMSEDAVTLIEAENKIIFMVNIRASKSDIKRAVEELYDVQVARVTTMLSATGTKKAFVKLMPESKAADLAVRLGIL